MKKDFFFNKGLDPKNQNKSVPLISCKLCLSESSQWAKGFIQHVPKVEEARIERFIILEMSESINQLTRRMLMLGLSKSRESEK